MAAPKIDIEVSDLSDYQETAAQLQTGVEVCITSSRESPEFQVQTKAGQLIGRLVAKNEHHRDLLTRGRGVVRSLRKQQGTVLQVLLRVTDAPPQPLLPQSASVKEEEVTEAVVRQDVLYKLASSEDVRAQLKDERLQELIKRIDSAPDREKALRDDRTSFGSEHARMFDYVDMLQGPSKGAVDSDDESADANTGVGENQAQDKPAGNFSFWGMATALAENVKKSTADIATSVKETDWRAELQSFSKGVAEDSAEASQLVHKGLERFPKAKAEATAHLPASLGVGLEGLGEHVSGSLDAVQVQEHFNKVGSKLRGLGTSVFTGTRELLEQVTDAISSELDSIEGMAARNRPGAAHRSTARFAASGGSAKYSRLDAEVSAMQRNSSTYCDEPADAADYAAWLAGFDLAARKPDIDAIVADNAFMAELQARIVPLIVQYEEFWTRYFYQLHKLQQKHEQRVAVAQRARAAAEDEVAWDDDPRVPSPVASPVQATRIGVPSPAKDAVRVGTQNSPPPPPVSVKPVSSPRAEDKGSSSSSPVKVKRGDEHSDVETSTASDDSNSVHPWTVVTSPSARAAAAAKAASVPEEGEVSSPIASDLKPATASPANPVNPRRPDLAAADTAEGSGESPAAKEEATRQAPVSETPTTRRAADKKPSAAVLPPATDKKAAAAVSPSATDKLVAAGTAVTGAVAAAKPSTTEEEDEDLEISDEDVAAAEAGDSDVDEDWGGDWE
ncbi:g8384 [Coccomyxa elongata]